ncbi:MAG: glycosyltransferase family 9 protein [Proteobacteria bacterium]|nr:glycosyltransferase family 9 protein [Pseudomonadota bacterium]
MLANSYNAPVLAGNPDVDAVFAYRKLKHLGKDESLIAALAGRAAMLWDLRRRRLDLAIIAAGELDTRGERFAKLLSPGRTVRSAPPAAGQHEVERTFTAARALGCEGPIPPMKVVPGALPEGRIRSAISKAGLKSPVIGVHISARREAQRWPAERFAHLVRTLRKLHGAATLLFWSPGGEDHPQHPGDDGKAKAVMDLVGGEAALLPCPTAALEDLIAGLAQCDAVVCSDGGAMHLAAALGKPVACFFGDSPVDRWRPWGVRHIVLQAPTRRVQDIPVEDAAGAVSQLLRG